MADNLLVIGNGFDLAAGAKTSYGNYFESEQYRETRENAIKWINHCLMGNYRSSSFSTLYSENPEPFNCWDLLFCMKSMHFDTLSCYAVLKNWCDIEAVIHDSLTLNSRKKFSWCVIYDCLHKLRKNEWGEITNYPELKEHNIMFKYLVSTGWEKKSDSMKHFYSSLLDELKNFEHSFGRYISIITEASDDYQYNAKRYADQLSGTKVDILVDSFNYSDFYGNCLKIRHINGNTDNPIFGIDLSEAEEEEHAEACCFTKTSRRLQQDALRISDLSDDGIESINSAVVFGHSLNMMDYDYFNYLFTMLKFNTYDISKMGKIVFAYKSHGEDPNAERLRYAGKVYSILNRYEKNVSKSNQHILINMLRFSGKLTFWELS